MTDFPTIARRAAEKHADTMNRRGTTAWNIEVRGYERSHLDLLPLIEEGKGFAQHKPECQSLKFLITDAEKARFAYCNCGLKDHLSKLSALLNEGT